ncbi:hypothetical protein [Amycolatopsis sp. CA-128772]|uniref:hypothetical protein n=1 Tax=Amycolatopsis sp. CA-128772 TaxID=2073159 RepID=UPI000CD04FB9|nr:hypothetical protein [Amycolatopsis sp. CA-128772]
MADGRGIEQRLTEAAVIGTFVDLRTGDPAADDPAGGARWPAARTVRADLIARLVTGSQPPPRAVRLGGVRVTGRLDLESAVLRCPLVLDGCYFDDPVTLQQAQAVTVRLPGCHLPGIAADELHVRGALVLEGLVASESGVSLSGARVDGYLDFDGATLTNPDGLALYADSLRVDQSVYCRNGFTAAGEVRLFGARVGGNLELDGAALANPDGPALNADSLTVDQSMYCRDGFSADGEVNLLGAQIGGSLEFDGATLANPDGPALNADSLSVGRAMFCRNGFTATGEVRLLGAHVGGNLELDGAVLNAAGRYALNADSLTAEQSVYCRNGFTADGEVNLLGANVAGSVDFEGATLRNPGGYALYADSLTVGRAMFCRNGFTAVGEVNLLGAHVGASLDFENARLSNPLGYALNGDSLTVDHAMFCRHGFSAEGEVNLLSAHVGGNLDFDRATLANQHGYALYADSLTVGRAMFCRNEFTAVGEVNLFGAQIAGSLDFTGAALENPGGLALGLESARAGALFLTPRARPDGVVDLTNTRVTSFHDALDGWPAHLRLRGFSYEVLENDSVSVRTRLKWLARHQGGYAPGLYDQLAAAYRRDGHSQAARRVGIAKQWRRRRALNPLGKAWNWLLYLTVGYGYRTWLAGLWLAGLVAVGTAVFAGAYPAQLKAASATVPAFQPAAYTLDVMLPIVDLGQKKNWFPQETAQVWSWVLTGAGWVLTTAVVAGLTNALKRD